MNTVKEKINIVDARNNKYLKEEFFKQNIKLVYMVTNKMKHVQMDKDEKFSLGSFGLMKAFDTYKEDSGYAFSTYAVRCISNEILMENRRATNRHRKNMLSLDGAIRTDKDGDEQLLLDIIPSLEEEFDSEDYTLAKKVYKKFIEMYSEKDVRLIQAFNMFIFENKTTKEIAESVGLTDQSSGSRIATRAIKALQDIAIEMELIENYNRYAKKPIAGEGKRAKAEKEVGLKQKALYIILNYPELSSREIGEIMNWSSMKISKVKDVNTRGKIALTPDDSIKPKVEEYLARKLYY